MPLSLSRVSRGQQTGQAGPQCAVPKPGPCPKFALPSLVTPCPFLLPAQACTPTPAVTHVSARTMSSEKTFQGWLLSQPRRNGSRSELGPEHPRPSLAPQPSVPLPVPRACLVTGARGVPLRCSAACSGGWRVDPTKQVDGDLVQILTVGPRGKTSSLISPTTPPWFSPALSCS